MKIKIIAIGKLKDKNIKALIDEYIKRTKWTIDIVEVEAKTKDESKIKDEEGKLLLSKVPSGYCIIALNENGKQFESPQLHKELNRVANQSSGGIAFIIGGASGLSDEVKKATKLSLSLGLLTYPHMLARLLLVEQVYRIWTIGEGKAYHK
ncbi:MAG TPA: 23S rRNA (pseudouridine(1915)-N(3))-methyltransferase RlmH [Alphaproteobacteria bacterium]|nr:23S rRNA (pseudouridine(1915)-N(3))-methyltransferase RlmH [Alphaproteobacteria bacterium]